MTRFNYAYLDLEDSQGVATFEMQVGFTTQGETEKRFLMGDEGFGQYVTEIFNQLDVLGEVDSTVDRRAGFYLDGGAGMITESLNFKTGLDDVTWGDGSGGTGEANVTPRDASGPGIKAATRKHIFDLWVARSLTDSRNPARLYFGEWTDGSKAQHSEAGAFNQPMPCAVKRVTTNLPDPNDDDKVSLEGTIELSMLTPFADYDPPSWLESSNIGTFAEHVATELEEVSDS